MVPTPTPKSIEMACKDARRALSAEARAVTEQKKDQIAIDIQRRMYKRRLQRDVRSTVFSRYFYMVVLHALLLAVLFAVMYFRYPADVNALLTCFAVLEIAGWAYNARYSFSRSRVKGHVLFAQYFCIFCIHGLLAYGSLYLLDELNGSNLSAETLDATYTAGASCVLYSEAVSGSKYAQMCPQVLTHPIVSPARNPYGINYANDRSKLDKVVTSVESIEELIKIANNQYFDELGEGPAKDIAISANGCNEALRESVCHSITPLCGDSCNAMPRCSSECAEGIQLCPVLSMALDTIEDYGEIVLPLLGIEELGEEFLAQIIRGVKEYEDDRSCSNTTLWNSGSDVCVRNGQVYDPLAHHHVFGETNETTLSKDENLVCTCSDGAKFPVSGSAAACSSSACQGGVLSLNPDGPACLPMHITGMPLDDALIKVCGKKVRLVTATR